MPRHTRPMTSSSCCRKPRAFARGGLGLVSLHAVGNRTKGARNEFAAGLRDVLPFLRADVGYKPLVLLVNTPLRRELSQSVQISPSERRDCAGCRQAYDLAPRTWPLGHRESTGSETVRPRAQLASRASCCVGQG
jgi:hypothetical protein